MTVEPLSRSERDAIAAGCGVLAIVGRLDRGSDLGPVLAALAERPPQQGYQALLGATTLYQTRLAFDSDDPTSRAHAAKLAVLATQWRRAARSA